MGRVLPSSETRILDGEAALVLPTEGLFDRLASQYDAWFDSAEGKPLFESEIRCIGPLLVAQPRPWLDVGTGTGRFAQALGVDVGIDPARGALAMTATRGVRVVQARGEALPFASSQFGAVLVVVTLCFAPMPQALLRECERVLADDGRILLGLVLGGSPWGRFYIQLAEAGHPFYSRARFYTVEEVRQLALRAGLTIVDAYSTLFQPPGAGSFMVEEPCRGMSPEAGFVAISLARSRPQASRRTRAVEQ
jgi:ubiquinone/menaquinone biosynthesis C-methylase UbiE